MDCVTDAGNKTGHRLATPCHDPLVIGLDIVRIVTRPVALARRRAEMIQVVLSVGAVLEIQIREADR